MATYNIMPIELAIRICTASIPHHTTASIYPSTQYVRSTAHKCNIYTLAFVYMGRHTTKPPAFHCRAISSWSCRHITLFLLLHVYIAPLTFPKIIFQVNQFRYKIWEYTQRTQQTTQNNIQQDKPKKKKTTKKRGKSIYNHSLNCLSVQQNFISTELIVVDDEKKTECWFITLHKMGVGVCSCTFVCVRVCVIQIKPELIKKSIQNGSFSAAKANVYHLPTIGCG